MPPRRRPATEAGRALLRERSPLHKAHGDPQAAVDRPGANDVRVKQAESDQIVDGDDEERPAR